MKKLIQAVIASCASLSLCALFLAGVSKATTIEGYTPSGNFQTVGVTDDGRLEIDISSNAFFHVIVDSGDHLIVTASTSTTVIAATVVVPANVATIIYPADPLRRQGFFCNDDLNGLTMHFGTSGVSNTTQKFLPPGCVSPDVPESFTGVIYGISTATISTSYWYTRVP